MSSIYQLSPMRPFTLLVGQTLDESLDWTAQTVIVDNFSTQFLYVPAANKFVDPGARNVVIPITTNSATALFQAPSGQQQPPVATGEARLVYYADAHPAQSGYPSLFLPQFQSIPDPTSYQPLIDHKRSQAVGVADYEYSEVQIGRLLYRDNFESPTQWNVISGTSAIDSTTFLKGSNSLKLTAAAGAAGNQCIIRKFFQVDADQFVSTFPLVVVELWFKALDANIRDIQFWIRPDNSLTRFEASIRYFFQQAGVYQGLAQYVDNTSVFQTFSNYPVRLGGGTVGDAWHHIMIALNYLQGSSSSGGYLTYQLLKFDDFTFKPTQTLNAHRIATNGFLESSIDIIVTTDNANASSINVDELIYADLSNVFQL